MLKTLQQQKPDKPELEKFFKVGVSPDYILIRGDFPITEISPGEFQRLCMMMFDRNDEALNGK